jgi:hypothetical protein
MKLNNINPCISGTYMLFSTNSTEPTRLWNRANSSGRSICCNANRCLPKHLLHEKLKYTVLQYKEDNNGSGMNTTTSAAFNSFISDKITNRNFTRHPTNTIELNNTLYYVEPSIKTRLITYLKEHFTKEQLKHINIDKLREIIIKLKQKYNLHIPKEILLKTIPLSQYKTRYTYLASMNNWNNDPNVKIPIYENPLSFDIPFQCGTIITNSTILAPFSDKNNNVFSILYKLSFPNVSITSNNIQFIYVIQNNTCTYTGKVEQLFPAQNKSEIINSASFWGSSIISPTSLNNFIKTRKRIFDPIFAIIQPGSWKVHCGKYPARFGILLSFYTFVLYNKSAFKEYYHVVYPSDTDEQLEAKYNLYLNQVLVLTKNNSDLIFIPIQTELGVLNTFQYPVGYLVNIPFATDDINSIKSIKKELNDAINQYLGLNNIQYKLLQPYVNTVVSYINFLHK